MSTSKLDELLAGLSAAQSNASTETWTDLAASEPAHSAVNSNDGAEGEQLDALVDRIHQITSEPPETEDAEAGRLPVQSGDAQQHSLDRAFIPTEPETLAEAEITQTEVEALILKYLLARGEATGRQVTDQIKLPFLMVESLMQQMKQDDLVGLKGAAAMNDFRYTLSETGRQLAKRHTDHCTYFGAAPVSLSQYISSIQAQSLAGQHPTVDDLRRAFDDLLIETSMLTRLGPAINSGRGLFLFGAPGNGKTSIAERVTKSFGEFIWIPRAVGVDGEIMRLFDPMNHEEVPPPPGDGLLRTGKIDERWVRIRRPTIVVGGELTMDQLEVTLNTATGINESPLQMKSNCGTLVIDDFGRQRMTTDELLNRWIVPLEKRYDFLNLASGKKVQVPFDQLIIFSTNLEPKDLVDEAFLRRIPYKIEVVDPSEENFRELFKIMAGLLDIPYCQQSIDYLMETHYKSIGRPMRNCQPRDLLLQVRNFCLYEDHEIKMTREHFDFAVENYFAVM